MGFFPPTYQREAQVYYELHKYLFSAFSPTLQHCHPANTDIRYVFVYFKCKSGQEKTVQ